jgi:hypothetical protein
MPGATRVGSLTLDGVLVRRLLLLLAVLIALTALAGSIAPVQIPSTTPAPSPTPTASPAARPEVPDVRAALSAAPGRAARRIVAQVGDRVWITVRGGAVDSVALGDIEVQPLERGLPARFDVLADAAGSYPLVLEDDGRRIATLEVR